MVNSNGFVKIIDFGFGKKFEFDDNDFEKSITLNWRYTPPIDFKDSTYNFKTEIYFIGKLFEEIIVENNIQSFNYKNILSRMTAAKPQERIASFFEITREILNNKSLFINFNYNEKKRYQEFANSLTKLLSYIDEDCEYISEIENIVKSLEYAYEVSMLEQYVQNNVLITSCFLKGIYKSYNKIAMNVVDVRNFIDLLTSSQKEKQKIIINNIWQRLDSVKRTSEDNDLPF